MSLYSLTRKIYHKVESWPLVGKIFTIFAPWAKSILLGRTRRSASTKTALQETAMQAVMALQKSVKIELAKNAEELKKELSDYRERMEFIRAELFEEIRSLGGKAGTSSQAKAEILNQEKYNQAVKDNVFRLNIGCGHKIEPEYLNIDCRNLPGVDILARADRLPFEPDSLAEIYASHLLEHFTQVQLQTLLPYWYSLLMPGGKIMIVAPNAEAMITAYANGQMTFNDLRDATFGAQEYSENFNNTMFTPDSLANLLRVNGFINVNINTVNRVNGKFREMELSAEK